MRSDGVNLFAPLSPYNLFLSFAIASTETKGEENVIMLTCFNEINEKCLGYLGSKTSTFSRAIRLFKGKSRETFLTRPFRKIELFRTVNEIFSQTRIENYYFFNDFKYQTQYSIATLAKIQPKANTVYVEDGTGDYCEVYFKKKGALQNLRDRVLYKDWCKEIDAFGTHPLLNEYRFIYPEHSNVSPGVTAQRKSGISSLGIPKLDYDEEAIRFFGKIEAEAILKRNSIILFLDSAEYIQSHPGYYEKIINICEKGLSDGMNILIKGKDRNLYPETGFERDSRFFILPSHIPSELILLWFRENIRKVFGGKSSALMTARWLTPEIPCSCICPFITERASRLGLFFRNIGILPYENGELQE